MQLLDYLRQWIKQLILIIVLAGFIDLLLPTGNTRKFARVVVGLFVIMVLLNPLLLILRQDVFLRLPNFDESYPVQGELSSVSSQGEVLAATVQEQALAHYRRQLEEQARALVVSLEEVSQARVRVFLDRGGEGEGAIVGLAVWIKEAGDYREEVQLVERIEVQINGDVGREEGENIALPEILQEQITAVLTTFFNIEPEAISIFAWEEDFYD